MDKPFISATSADQPSVDSSNHERENDSAFTADDSTSDNASSAHTAKKKKHKAQIEHKILGRMRIKIPSAKDKPEILETYQKIFSTIPGIFKVKIKPETGSIIIHYDPKRDDEFHTLFHSHCEQHHMEVSARPGDEFEEMVKKIEAEAEFLAGHSHMARATVDLFKGLDNQIKVLTGNTIDLKIVLAGSLAAVTFIEIGAEAATPMWVTLALFGTNHFIEMRHESTPVTSTTTPNQSR